MLAARHIARADKFADYAFIFTEISFIGWIYEVFLDLLIYGKGFVNSSTLHGPFLQIYGFGGILLVLSLKRLMQKDIRLGQIKMTPLLVFLGIVIISTVFELLGGLFLRHFNLPILWDYSRFRFHFQGLIAPNPSIRFGLIGLLLLYVILPAIQKLSNRIPAKTRRLIAAILVLYFLIDHLASYVFT